MNGNAGFLFYNEFYDKYQNKDWKEIITKKKSSDIELFEKTQNHIKEINNKILKIKIIEEIEKKEKKKFLLFKTESIKLKTTYPGLVLGTGYHHETGVEGEFKIGFYFDYTTGLPVIPGSSVKGLIRSAFPGRGKLYKKERKEYIKEILKESTRKILDNYIIDDLEDDKKALQIIADLEDEIFEGIKDKNATKIKDKYLPLYKRDIFYDAFPIAVDKDGLFKDDFLAPHGDNPLKNPIPLKFLKVAPEVTFQFNFDLKDSEILIKDKKIFTKDIKRELFSAILLDFGIGAKTNVGYGKFDRFEFEKAENIKRKKQELEKKEKKLANMSEVDREIFTIKKDGSNENDVSRFYNKIDNFKGKDQKKAALFIKECFENKNKWKKPKKKQSERVKKIKRILEENM
ncbi:MAG: type III-B CRISPR module RAMP protein Cmr6 [Desulfobacteraceae bacterium 4572_130]|nr:MAG: type III-B CRISPR module RAMP protein Cmr6 [Desulfobacteraceae bacterium 4572_130]